MTTPLTVWLLLMCKATACFAQVAATTCGSKASVCVYSAPCAIDSSMVDGSLWTGNSQGCQIKLAKMTDPKLNAKSMDDLVAHWNPKTGVCSLFHYQHVCRQLQTTPGDCSMYRLSALVSCDASLLNPRLLGVWLAGSSNRLSNLVCQSDPNNYRMVSVNIAWSDEGAVFNGVSSYALVNDSRFMPGPANSSFTWLMRLKRVPNAQPFIAAASCQSSTTGPYLSESTAFNPGSLYYSTSGRTPPYLGYETPTMLPGDSGQWVDIAVTFNGANLQIYVNGNFASSYMTFSVTKQNPQFDCYVIRIGHPVDASGSYFKGTVRAVAVTNASLTLPEIRQFFTVLP